MNEAKQTTRTVELVGGPFDGDLVTLFRFVFECQMQGRTGATGTRSVWHQYEETAERTRRGHAIFRYVGRFE